MDSPSPEDSKKKNDSTNGWFLRKPGGAVFGPIEISELRRWSMDGRIGADDDVSKDREKWMPAPSHDALEMFYAVRISDDYIFGPVHLYALSELLNQRSIKADSEVIDQRTGERSTVARVLLPALVAERQTLRAEMAKCKEAALARKPERDTAIKSSKTDLRPLQKENEALNARVKDLQKVVDDHKKELKRLCNDLVNAKTENGKRQEELAEASASREKVKKALRDRERDVTRLKEELGKSRKDQRELDQKARLLTGRLEKLETSGKEAEEMRQKEASTLEENVAALKDTLRDVRRQYEQLKAEVIRERDERERARSNFAEREKALMEHIELLQQEPPVEPEPEELVRDKKDNGASVPSVMLKAAASEMRKKAVTNSREKAEASTAYKRKRSVQNKRRNTTDALTRSAQARSRIFTKHPSASTRKSP